MKAIIIGAIASVLSLAALFPLFVSSYVIAFLFNLLLNLSLMIGMNLLWGFAGYLPLGYTAFFGLGGYVTARLVLQGWPIWLSLPLSLIFVLPIGAFFGWVLFRLRGLYFSAASLGLLILLEETSGKWTFLSGGHEGLALPSSPKGPSAYWLILALSAFSLAAHYVLDRCKGGYQLRLIREDEALAESVGVPTFGVKMKAFLLGAVIALLAGGIHVWQAGYISPASAFGLSVAVPPVIMVLIGGGRKGWGLLTAALFVSLLQEALWTAGGKGVLSGYGLILIGVGMFWKRKKK